MSGLSLGQSSVKQGCGSGSVFFLQKGWIRFWKSICKIPLNQTFLSIFIDQSYNTSSSVQLTFISKEKVKDQIFRSILGRIRNRVVFFGIRPRFSWRSDPDPVFSLGRMRTRIRNRGVKILHQIHINVNGSPIHRNLRSELKWENWWKQNKKFFSSKIVKQLWSRATHDLNNYNILTNYNHCLWETAKKVPFLAKRGGGGYRLGHYEK